MAKVIFLTTCWCTGGPTQVVLAQARALQRRGVQVAVWGLSTPEQGWEPPADLNCRSLNLPKASGRRDTSRHLTEALRPERPDVLHLHSFSPHVHGVRAAVALGVPSVVVSFHDLRLGARRALICRHLARRVTRVIVLNQPMAELYRHRCGYTPEQIAVLPNGVDVQRFAPRPRDQELAQRLGLRSEDFVIGSVGSLRPNKGYRFLLEAFAAVRRELPTARLVLVGAGDRQRELQALAHRLGLGSSALLVGEQQDIPRWMSLFQVYVQPSLIESHGLALNEAMAMALPCVATNRGGMPELLDGGRVGMLVPPHRAQPLAQAILALAKHPQRARALGEAARRRAVEHYSIEGYEQKLWAIYTPLLTPGAAACSPSAAAPA